MLDAKTHLSRLIADLEEHREEEVIIAQAQTEPLRLLTGDGVISRYSELVVLV